MNHIGIAESLLTKNVLEILIGGRFISNLITTGLAIWSYIMYGNPKPSPIDDSGLYRL